MPIDKQADPTPTPFSRRTFIGTTLSGSTLLAGPSSFSAEKVANTNQSDIWAANWPSAAPLLQGLLRPMDTTIPSPDKMFGPDPRAMIKEALIPPPGEQGERGKQHAAFIISGLRYVKTGSWNLPMIKSSPEAFEAFWVGLLPRSSLVTQANRIDCPLCKNRFGGLDIQADSGTQATTRCCKKTVNSTTSTLIQFDQEIAYGRWRFLLKYLGSLIFASIYHKQTKATRTLVALVRAFPDTLPHLPWQTTASPDGLARRKHFPPKALPDASKNVDPEGFLTDEEMRHFEVFCNEVPLGSIPAKSLYRISPEYERDRQALLAEAVGTVWNQLNPEEKKVTTDCLRTHFCLIRHLPQMRGNFPGYSYPMSVSIAIASADQAWYDELIEFYRDYLTNHFYDDGMSVEGALNYGAMLGWIYQPGFRNRLGPKIWKQLVERRPLLARIAEVDAYPVRTLMNIESQHGDEHIGFFESSATTLVDSPEYARTESSDCFLSYGLTCLRGGSEGSRLELILDFQPAVLHSHTARLNVQLFYEGINLLPELGYAAEDSVIAPEDIPDPIKKQGSFIPKPTWFNNALEVHCSATIDGHQGNDPNAFISGYYGKGNLSAPGAFLRQIRVRLPQENFAAFPGDITHCEREVMVVTLPTGQAIAISLFHLSGGKRHDLYWHTPADLGTTSLGQGKKEPVANLYEYLQHAVPNPPPFGQNLNARKGTFGLVCKKAGQQLTYGEDSRALSKVRTWKVPDNQLYHFDWKINPADYIIGREPEAYLKPVDLRMWCAQKGTDATETAIGYRCPWPAIATVEKYRKGVLCRDDALDVLTMQRHHDSDLPLETTFANIIAPAKKGEKPPLREVEIIPSDDATAHRGTGFMLHDAEGNVCAILSASDGEIFSSTASGLSLTGQTGKVSPALHEVVLCGGSHLRALGYEVKLSPTLKLSLEGLIGDLTGSPDESALIVRSDENLLPEILIGTYLFVHHSASAAHQSCYEIASVRPIGEGLYRIDLANNPPFALTVHQIESLGSTYIRIPESWRFTPNRPDSFHRMVYFPSVDFKTHQVKARSGGSAQWCTHEVHVADKLPPELKPGDPMILYSIQAGDQVVIASSFACRKIDNHLEIETTSSTQLTIPSLLPIKEIPDNIQVENDHKTTRLTIPPGRHQLRLAN